MRRFLTLVFLICFIISSFSTAVFAENVIEKADTTDNEALLMALGLLSDEVIALEDDAAITRGQLAFTCARLLNIANPDSTEAYFTDVPKESTYFSDIEVLRISGLVSGRTDNMYYPDEYAVVDELVKILVSMLGYDDPAKLSGGFPDGYRKFATRLKLYKNADSMSGILTKENLIAIAANSLDAEAHNIVYSEGKEFIDEGKQTLREKNLKVFKYSGKIAEVNAEDYSVSMLIEENENYEILSGYSVGETVRLDVSTDIDINLYENVPMDFWVSENGKIVFMLLESDISVKYATVYSVNDDTNELHKYRKDKIDEITILDDKTIYGIHEDFSVKYNGRIISNSASVGLAGKFAKIVTQNKEILFIESWDMTEGGIITEITYENISYIKGESNRILENFHEFANRVVIIDGKGSTVDDMKTGSYFSYHASDDGDTIVLAMSDIVITDTLYSLNNESVDIGNMNFDTSKNLYCFTEMPELRNTIDKSELLNMMVEAHLDHHGRVAYIVLSNDETEKLEQREFVGYLQGMKQETFGNVKVSIIVLRDEPRKDIFTISKNVKMEDGLVLNDVLASGGSLTADSLYKFTVNNNAEISRIAKLSPYYGFGEAVCTPTSFVQAGNPHMMVNGTKLFFDRDTLIYALYESDGEHTAERFAWDDLTGGTCSNITMRFYGGEEESDVSLILLTGNIGSITSDSSYVKNGILKRKATALDEDGNTCCKLYINDETYIVDETLGASLEVPSYVRYSDTSFATKNDIKIIEDIHLSGDFEDWQSEGTTTKLRRGIVKKIDGKRLYLEDGSVYFIYPQKGIYIECDSNNKFNKTSYKAIGVGEEVVYSVYDNCVFVILYR